MDRAEETRQQIADAGYRCIARWGVSRTTMADLAREAGVSRATLYRYFPGGREEVFAQSINDAVVAFFRDLLAAVEGAASLEEMLEIGLPRAHRQVEEHEVLQAVLRNEPEALHLWGSPWRGRARGRGLPREDAAQLHGLTGPLGPRRPSRGPDPGARRAARGNPPDVGETRLIRHSWGCR